MAVPLISGHWQSSSVVTATQLGQYFIGSDPAAKIKLPRRALISDSGYLVQELARETGAKMEKVLGMTIAVSGDFAFVRGHGIGGPAIALTLELIAEMGAREVVHIGTAGALQSHLEIGDVLIAEAAYRDEGTSYHYLPPGELVVSDLAEVGHWQKTLLAAHLKVHRGPIWTTDALFRETPEAVKALAARGVLGVEMEAASALAVAAVRGLKLTCLRLVSDRIEQRGWQPHFQDSNLKRTRRRLVQTIREAWR